MYYPWATLRWQKVCLDKNMYSIGSKKVKGGQYDIGASMGGQHFECRFVL